MTEGKVTGANVSVKLDDAFMQAAVDEKPYVQQYPIDSANRHLQRNQRFYLVEENRS